jgi:hypothetical protein
MSNFLTAIYAKAWTCLRHLRQGEITVVCEKLQRLARSAMIAWELRRGRKTSRRSQPVNPLARPALRLQYPNDGKASLVLKQDERPALSVIIPFYNSHRYLAETLASLEQQTLHDCEILLINDGSDDPAACRMLEALRPAPRLRLVDCAHCGLPAARNRGVREARSNLIVFVDADDLLERTALEKMVLALRSRPTVAFVYCGVVHFGDLDEVCLDAFDAERLKRENYLPAFTNVMRREVYLDVGGMDEALVDTYEDYDFWLRLLLRGYVGWLLPEVLFYYRRHLGGNRARLRRTHGEGAMLRKLRCRYPEFYGGKPVDRSTWHLLKDQGMAEAQTLTQQTAAHHASEYEDLPSVSPRRAHLPNLFASDLWDSDQLHLLYIMPRLDGSVEAQHALAFLRRLPPQRYRVALVADESAGQQWYEAFSRVADSVFVLAPFDFDNDQQDCLLDYLLISRAIDVVYDRHTAVGRRSMARWQAQFSRSGMFRTVSSRAACEELTVGLNRERRRQEYLSYIMQSSPSLS